MKKAAEIFFNFLFWLGIYYILVKFLATENVRVEELSDGTVILETTYSQPVILMLGIGLLFKAGFYYFNVYCLSKYFDKQNWTTYLWILLRSLLFFLFSELAFKVLFFKESPTSNLSMWLNAILNFWLQYLVLGVVSIAHIVLLRSRQEVLQQQQLEKEKTLAELNALKAQINPHFLFNALNNLLSITNKAGNQEASAVITQLSAMMRFLLHDVVQKRIPIEKEIEFIQNYISMNQLRFSSDDPIDIQFDYSKESIDWLIEPALFIPFLENAFKHGIDIFKSSFIHIKLQTLPSKKIQFQVMNSNHHKLTKELNQFEKNTGIGLNNVKKRLAIAYPNQHTLLIQSTEQYFEIHLSIDL